MTVRDTLHCLALAGAPAPDAVAPMAPFFAVHDGRPRLVYVTPQGVRTLELTPIQLAEMRLSMAKVEVELARALIPVPDGGPA